jgi:DNA-binding protein YbaB
MMPSFKQARDMFRLQRQAKQVRRELKKIHVEAESKGVRVVVSGEQKVIAIDIAGDVLREKIPEILVDALNRALSKAQIVSSQKMQGVMGEMGFPVSEGS